MTDREFVERKLLALVEQTPERMLSFVHDEPPVTWQRPRYNPQAKKFFTAKKAKAGERSLGWAFARALHDQPMFPDTVALFAIFFLPDLRDRDTDNLVKLVMDAGTKAHVWTDDVRVRTHGVLIDLDRERPRTVLAVCPYLSVYTMAPLFMESRVGS